MVALDDRGRPLDRGRHAARHSPLRGAHLVAGPAGAVALGAHPVRPGHRAARRLDCTRHAADGGRRHHHHARHAVRSVLGARRVGAGRAARRRATPTGGWRSARSPGSDCCPSTPTCSWAPASCCGWYGGRAICAGCGAGSCGPAARSRPCWPRRWCVWNAQHEWASFAKQFGRAGRGQGWTLTYLAELIGAFVGLASPLIAVLAIAGLVRAVSAAVRERRSGAHPARRRVSSPLLAYFLVHALHSRVQPNWLAPLYPAFAICAAIAVASGAGAWPRRVATWAVPVGFLCSALIYAHALHPLHLSAYTKDPSAQMRGWARVGGRAGCNAPRARRLLDRDLQLRHHRTARLPPARRKPRSRSSTSRCATSTCRLSMPRRAPVPRCTWSWSAGMSATCSMRNSQASPTWACWTANMPACRWPATWSICWPAPSRQSRRRRSSAALIGQHVRSVTRLSTKLHLGRSPCRLSCIGWWGPRVRIRIRSCHGQPLAA